MPVKVQASPNIVCPARLLAMEAIDRLLKQQSENVERHRFLLHYRAVLSDPENEPTVVAADMPELIAQRAYIAEIDALIRHLHSLRLGK